MKLKILIDSSCDLPETYLRSKDVELISFTYELDNNVLKDDSGKSLPYEKFYDEIRAGKVSMTSQINIFDYTQVFRKFLKEGYEIINICLSSGLSGSFMNAEVAREMILSESPDAKIHNIDSKSASLGEGLLCHYVMMLAESGFTTDSIVKWADENRNRVNHYFMVNGLEQLKRGGRIPDTLATVGSILQIKPILYVDANGKIRLDKKTMGRKRAMASLLEVFDTRAQSPEDQTIAISHSDCLEDALKLKDLISNKYAVKSVIINNIGPIIGTHLGADALCLFFIGKER